MDSFNSPDPLILLLNEIDILLAQMRLFELYIKQAQATAIYEATRGYEQYRAELASVRAALAESERSHAANQASAGLTEQNLLQRVQELETQLREKQFALDQRDAELKGAQARAASLDAQVDQLQITRDDAERAIKDSADVRRRLEVESDDLRKRLDDLQRTFHEQQAAWQASQHDGQAEIATLREQLSQMLAAAQATQSRLDQARREAIESGQRAAELELRRNEIQASAEGELAQAQSEFAAELDRLQTALTARDQALTEAQSIATQVESTLKTELLMSRSLLEQKQELIEFREGELREALERVATLEQRAHELETAHQIAVKQAYTLELTGRAYEQEIDSLRHEIMVRERTLSQRQEAVTAVELALHEKIQSLQQELARGRQQIDERDAELQRLGGEIAGLHEVTRRQEVLAAEDRTARRHAEEALTSVEAENHELVIRLAEKEQEAAEWENRAALTEQQSRGGIERLQSRLNEQQAVADQANREVERLRETLALLEKDNDEKERSRRELEESQRQLMALNQNLENRLHAAELAGAAAAQAALSEANVLRSQSEAKLRELRLQLAEHQLIGESRASEINDLKTQAAHLATQLAELDAANTELRKQFQTAIESERHQFQCEMAAYRDDSEFKQQALNDELIRERERAGILSQQVIESEQRVLAFANEIDERRKELQAITIESAHLSSRLDQLETLSEAEHATAEQEKAQSDLKFTAELAAVRQELQDKSQLSAQQQAALESLTVGHKNEIEGFELRVSELQNQIADRDLDLEKSRLQARLLEQRIEELLSERQQIENTAVNRAQQIRDEAGLRIAELESLVARQDHELQERRSSQAQLEQTLGQEIDRLVHDAQEKNQILQNRNDELVRVKAAMDPLQERLSEMESATTGMAMAAAAESERMRAEFQAQLALMQAELSQKDWTLEERQATIQALEQNYRQEIDGLRQQVDELASRKKPVNLEFTIGEAKPTEGRQPQFERAETFDGNGSDTDHSAQQRRWRSGFGWKRRWKSSETG